MSEDFDLDEILASAMERRSDEQAARKAKSKPAAGRSKAEQQLLLDYEAKHVWSARAHVGLLHTQECLNCHAQHQWFAGWFTEERHATDPHARRLVSGRAVGNMPLRLERHAQKPVDHCPQCVAEYVDYANAAREAAAFTMPERKIRNEQETAIPRELLDGQTSGVHQQGGGLEVGRDVPALVEESGLGDASGETGSPASPDSLPL